MNKPELKLKIQEVFIEFNKDKNYDFIFVAVDRSDEDKGAILIGFGCGRCMAEEISKNLNKFKHETNHKSIN